MTLALWTALFGLAGPAVGQQVKEAGRIIPIAPPTKRPLVAIEAKPGAIRKLPAVQATTSIKVQQDFLEDIPARGEVTPYPKPDFATPAEPVVPLPVQRAPEDFKGFEP